MKTLLMTIFLMSGSLAFAGGSTSGVGGLPDKFNASEAGRPRMRADFDIQPKMKKSVDFDQLYYMGQSDSIVKFATNIKGRPEVTVKTMDLRKLLDDRLAESLKKSQETQAWEDVKEVPESSEVDEKVIEMQNEIRKSVGDILGN